MLIDTETYGMTVKNFNRSYENSVADYLKKAMDLEKDKQRLRRILKLQKIFYQDIVRDKTKVKELNNKIKTTNKEIYEYIRRDYYNK